MLTIELEGARALLGLLGAIAAGEQPNESQLEAVLSANSFFVNFYSQWEGCNPGTIAQTIRYFNQPEMVPAGVVEQRMVEGFRQAVSQPDLLQNRMSWLRDIDTAKVAERVLEFLPEGTPLEATIHITVDSCNNAFVFQGGMGVSLLEGMRDIQAFEEAVSHELHHVCFRYWAAKNPPLQAILNENSGRSVAVIHVQNLLSEGLANFYLSPGYVFRKEPEKPPVDALERRLARLKAEEDIFFAQAEDILTLCLTPGAKYEPCFEAFKTVGFDLQDFTLPAGHYLGARMIQSMEKVHPRERIIHCVQRLRDFLPLYNEAARKTGGFTYNLDLVDQFTGLVTWADRRSME